MRWLFRTILLSTILSVSGCKPGTSNSGVSGMEDSIYLLNMIVPDIPDMTLRLDSLTDEIDPGKVLSRNPYYIVRITSLPDSDTTGRIDRFNVIIKWIQFSQFEYGKYYGYLAGPKERIYLLEKCDLPVYFEGNSVLAHKNIPVTSSDGHNMSIEWNYNFTDSTFMMMRKPVISRFNNSDTIYESSQVSFITDSLSKILKKSSADLVY